MTLERADVIAMPLKVSSRAAVSRDEPMSARSLRRAFAVTAVSAAACGPADRPPVGSDPVSTVSESVGPTQVCELGTWRECHVHYVDEDGREQCPASIAYCRPDGYDWYPCGEYTMGDAGVPVPRD